MERRGVASRRPPATCSSSIGSPRYPGGEGASVRGLLRGLLVVALCACGPGRSFAPGEGDQAGDAGTASASGGNSSGGGDGGGGSDGGPSGEAGPVQPTASCTPKARPPCAVFEVDPDRPIACRPQPVPEPSAEPALPTEIAMVDACDDREYDSAGNLISHGSTLFDAAGRPVQSIVATTYQTTIASSQYDNCGPDVVADVKDLDHEGQ